MALEEAGLVRKEDPLHLAQFVWATVHGIAMLAIDGMLDCRAAELEALARFANRRIVEGIAAD